MNASIELNLPKSAEITYNGRTYSVRWQHAVAVVLLFVSAIVVATASPVDTSSKDRAISKQLEVSAKALNGILK